MTFTEGSTINIGTAVREGVQLRTVEVMALLYEACRELERGGGVLSADIDELAVTDTGQVILPTEAAPGSPRVIVASLLDTLLPGDASVPPALRTLPSRLRDVGRDPDPSDLKDLFTILRWHLPNDAREVLKDLVVRTLITVPAEEAIDLDTFVDEDNGTAVDDEPAAIAAPVGVVVPIVATRPGVVVPIVAVPSVAAVPDVAPVRDVAAVPHVAASPSVAAPVNVAAAHPRAAVSPAPVAPVQRRSALPKLAAAAAAVAMLAAAGYGGYRYSRTNAVPATGSVAVAPEAPSRITVRDQQDPPPAVAPRVAQDLDPHPLRLDVNGGAFSPSFGAHGKLLLFHAGRDSSGRLFEAALDDRGRTTSLTPLLDERGRTYHARVSADNAWLAFDSDRDGERGVYVAERSTGRIARVSGEGFAAVPSWSPDMKSLAFIRGEASRPKVWNLWLRDIASGTLTRESAFRSGQVWGASWFPDSQSLCYTHDDQLIVRDLAAGTTRTFSTPIAGRLMRTPAVSPDGRRIAFQVYRDGAWLLDVKSGNMQRVLADPSAEEFAWDPSGHRLAYHSRRDGQWRIWMITL